MPKRTPVSGKKKTKKKAAEKRPSLSQLQKAFSKEIAKSDGVVEVLDLSDDDCVANVRKWVSTGSISLDRVLAGRGIPMGRLTEIYGPAHIGKSTLLDSIFASVQRAGGVGVLADADTGRDPHYSMKIGVNLQDLQYLEFSPDKRSAEHMIEAGAKTIEYWSEKSPDTMVVFGWDALGNTATMAELGKELTKKTTASAAKVMRAMQRRLTPLLTRSNVAIVVLNHEYSSISFGGGMQAKKTYGGDAIRSMASVRLKLHSVMDGWIKSDDGRVLGRKVGFELTKFKLGIPFQKGEFVLLSGSGIDNTYALYDGLVSRGIIQVSGAWGAVNLDNEIIKWQGVKQFRQKCIDEPEFFAALVNVYRSTS